MVRDGQVEVYYEGEGVSDCWTDIAALRERIDWARKVEPEVSVLLAIAEHLETDADLKDTRALTGVMVSDRART